MKNLVSNLLFEDSLSITASSLGCFTWFHCYMTLYNGKKLVFNRIDGGPNYKDEVSKSSLDSLTKYLATQELRTLESLFVDYSNRLYSLSSTSYDEYVISGKDTFVRLENPYYFENNPLDEVRDILNVSRAYNMAKL